MTAIAGGLLPLLYPGEDAWEDDKGYMQPGEADLLPLIRDAYQWAVSTGVDGMDEWAGVPIGDDFPVEVLDKRLLRKVCNGALHMAGGHGGLVTTMEKNRKVWDSLVYLDDDRLMDLCALYGVRVPSAGECEPLPNVAVEDLHMACAWLALADVLCAPTGTDFRGALRTKLAPHIPELLSLAGRYHRVGDALDVAVECPF